MSWQALVDMLAEAREIDQEVATRVPTVCPYDFTTLKTSPDGKLFCPWAGDYTYPDDGIVP
jgi:hypothetical protein